MAHLISIWPEWTRPYWLICIPIALLLLWALYRVKRKQQDWHSLLPQAFHSILLHQPAAGQRKAGYWILAAAWLCACIALLGPAWQTNAEQPSQKPQLAPLVIAIQLTPELLATDLPPNRLAHVREKVLHILEQRGEAVTALVVYAGSAHTLVPLSNDVLTSANLLRALHPKLMPKTGQRANLAVQQAIQLLQQGAQGAGQILLISTGVSVTEQQGIIKHLAKQPIQLKIMGVGSTAGAPIVASTQGHLLTDASGAIVISRLDPVSLQLLAEQTKSSYVQLAADHSDIETLQLLTQTTSDLPSFGVLPTMQQQDLGYWFILPVLLLTATFARRSGLLLLVLLYFAPTPSYAFDWDELWLRPDQRGEKLIEQQPARAAEHFSDPLWRATALYLAEDYLSAAQLFADFDTAEAHYNRGNALALAGLLPEAVAAYQRALQLAPELLVAQYNLQQVTEQLAVEQPSDTASEHLTDEPLDAPLSAADTVSSTNLTTPSATAQLSDENEPPNHSLSTAPQPVTPPLAQQESFNGPESVTIIPQQAVQPDHPTQPIQLESWLEQIPDNPSELLQRKFLYEHSMQEATP